jgi:hypothetical protein
MADESEVVPADAVAESAATKVACSCSPTTGVCKVCKRRHRIAYGIVAAVAVVTLAAWGWVFLVGGR